MASRVRSGQGGVGAEFAESPDGFDGRNHGRGLKYVHPEVFDMSTLTLPGTILAPRPETDSFRREQWAFYCMLGDLLKTHRGQTVAVHQQHVIASGPDRMAVVVRARELVGNVPIFVGLVTDEPPPVERVPRFRHMR
jgi:Family of unknown function (DUF5678)